MNLSRLPFLLLGLVYISGVHTFFNSLSQGLSAVFGGEYCSKSWISFKFHVLQDDLKSNLFGQPLVLESVAYAVNSHFKRETNSKKALALSFHGWQGSGKNYVADFIVKSIYKAGADSKFVHFFNGRLMFPLERLKYTYMHQLKNMVQNALSACPKSIFIFDEVDKMPRGVLDVLKPYLDYRHSVDGVVAREAIFVFLSNTGSQAILEKYLEYWNAGRDRYNLSLNDFDGVIRSGAFNEDGGLQFSDPVESNLIDHYVPFLPLEKSHIHRCIQSEMLKWSQSDQFDSGILNNNEDYIIEEVMKTVTFGPKPEKLFSTSGCKRIHQQVGTIMTRLKYKKKRSKLNEL